MRFERSLLVLSLAVVLVTVGCAGPSGSSQAEAMTVSPGTSAAMPLVLEKADVAPENVSVSTDADDLQVSLDRPANASQEDFAGWLSVYATAQAEDGKRIVDVTVGAEERQLPIEVDEPDEKIEKGQIANVTFSARTQTGELVMTNERNASEGPIPQSASFQAPPSFGPTPVQVADQGRLPGPLVDAIAGSEIGHSRSVDVPEVFGPEKVQENRSREKTVKRELTAPTELQYPTRKAQQLLPRDAQQGDEVDVPVTKSGQAVPYTVEKLGRQKVTFSLALEEGENVTLYEVWPDAAQVTNVTDGEATIRLSPDVEEGEVLTWNEQWGNVTEVVSVTNETIVLRHSPEVGLTYEQTSRRSQQVVKTEVVSVTNDTIELSKENPHPLAGETLTFDITIEDARDPPKQPRRPTGR